MILDKIFLDFETEKNTKQLYDLLFVLMQCSVFGDFGLSKTKLREILEMGNTKITEYLVILKKKYLCTEIQSRKYHYYQANLDELDKIKL